MRGVPLELARALGDVMEPGEVGVGPLLLRPAAVRGRLVADGGDRPLFIVRLRVVPLGAAFGVGRPLLPPFLAVGVLMTAPLLRVEAVSHWTGNSRSLKRPGYGN